jgi:hypothetical protein
LPRQKKRLFLMGFAALSSITSRVEACSTSLLSRRLSLLRHPRERSRWAGQAARLRLSGGRSSGAISTRP